jgi:hypothetical protein
MHGLVHKAFRGFVQAAYGPATWAEVTRRLGELPAETFAAQDPGVLAAALAATAAALDRPAEAVLEDFGIYLASHPEVGQIRRLLRFGGDGLVDFLISLEDLPDRCRLALPTLALPEMRVEEVAEGRFLVTMRGGPPGAGHVMTGLLRAMADDYGALALLEHRGDGRGEEGVAIHLIDAGHQEARAFRLVETLP